MFAGWGLRTLTGSSSTSPGSRTARSPHLEQKRSDTLRKRSEKRPDTLGDAQRRPHAVEGGTAHTKAVGNSGPSTASATASAGGRTAAKGSAQRRGAEAGRKGGAQRQGAKAGRKARHHVLQGVDSGRFTTLC